MTVLDPSGDNAQDQLDETAAGPAEEPVSDIGSAAAGEDIPADAGGAEPFSDSAAERGDGAEDDVAPQEEAATGESMRDFFQQLLNAMGVQGSVGLREDTNDQVTLDILRCPDASLIIGRHGQTVDDLQYLGSLILNNNRRDRKRFLLNVENYRERREETLRRSAIDLARQVAEFNQEAVLDPLPPHERRIVHLALVDMPEVYTYSEGEEPDRRIVISPRNLLVQASDSEPLMDAGSVTESESIAVAESATESGAGIAVETATAAESTPQAGAVTGAESTAEAEPTTGAGAPTETEHSTETGTAAAEDSAEIESVEAAMEESSEEAGLGDLPLAKLSEGGGAPSHDAHQGTAGAGLGIPRAELADTPDESDAAALPETTPGGGSHEGHTGE